MYAVELRGVDYPVKEFSKTYFQGLIECLAKNRIANVTYLNNSAQVIKRIAVPAIPDEIISESETEDDLYIWRLDPVEIAELILKIAAVWLQRSIDSRQYKDGLELAIYQKQLQMCHESLVRIQSSSAVDTNVIIDVKPPETQEDKQQRIAKLKAEISALESGVNG